METDPEQDQSTESTPRQVQPVRGWLRLVALLVVLTPLTAYGVTMDTFERPPRHVARETEEPPSSRAKLAQRASSREPAAPVPPHNGFDVSGAIVPTEEILRGGPQRDGIPSIDKPKFLSAAKTDYLNDADQVVGIELNGDARAYPLRILVWHEIVNDTVGGHPIAVTYCPLCGTCMVFDRQSAEGEMSLGVSGLLYNSDMLMYDRRTKSLWSQLLMKAVAGPLVGRELGWMASEQMTWGAWKERYPDSKVLSTQTGHARNYGQTPYKGYEDVERTYFPVARTREELGNKEWVAGIVVNGVVKAYPLKELESTPLEDTVGGTQIQITYDKERDWVVFVERATGNAIPHVRSYWFAWQGFYPRTLLHASPPE